MRLLNKLFAKHKYKVVNIYSDQDNTLIFLPTGISKPHRQITDLDIQIILKPPYSSNDIENKLLEAMNCCFRYEPEDISYATVYEKAKATRAYNKKIKGKRLVSLFWNIDDGYMVEPFCKAKDRGFNIIKDKVIRLGMSYNKGDLGKAIAEAFLISEPN